MGHPHTEALHLTERFRRRDAGHLEIEVTIDDPKAYTKPITYPCCDALCTSFAPTVAAVIERRYS